MPNWCENDLYIHGNRGEAEKFRKFAGSGDSSSIYFGQFIPYPDKYARADKNWVLYDAIGEIAKKLKLPTVKDGFNAGGYNWCVAHWGTKWGPSGVRASATTRGAAYRFNTAWAPPLPVVLAMSEKFPSLKFTIKYYEAGNAFKGTLVCKGGAVIERSSESYSGGRGG